ncbi:MAG: PIN domain-containing protein [Pseudomonadota bacterium]
MALTESLALLASELSQKYKLSFADAIIYATAQQEKVDLITADEHFENLPNVLYFAKKKNL